MQLRLKATDWYDEGKTKKKCFRSSSEEEEAGLAQRLRTVRTCVPKQHVSPQQRSKLLLCKQPSKPHVFINTNTHEKRENETLYPATCAHLTVRAVQAGCDPQRQKRREAVWRWRDSRQRWIRPRRSTFPDWTHRLGQEEQEEEEEQGAKTVAAKSAGQLISCSRGRRTHEHVRVQPRTRSTNPSLLFTGHAHSGGLVIAAFWSRGEEGGVTGLLRSAFIFLFLFFVPVCVLHCPKTCIMIIIIAPWY